MARKHATFERLPHETIEYQEEQKKRQLLLFAQAKAKMEYMQRARTQNGAQTLKVPLFLGQTNSAQGMTQDMTRDVAQKNAIRMILGNIPLTRYCIQKGYYKQLAVLVHPDKCPLGEEAFKILIKIKNQIDSRV